DDAWMQAVARELNLAETAFLLPRGDGFSLRWFTPTVEVDLCGHATLASAHLLWEDGHLDRGVPARFHTRSGLLTAARDGDWIALAVGRTRFDYLVELESETTLRALRPDLAALARLSGRGVIVTSSSARPEFDFVSRFFAPAAGVPEDPVTGS